ncbi:MAG TPA: nucleotidyltransferase family protein [Longimicrobiales bacterium]|nr:nucleotidyltransferase family protein [Longimicrobiales bacterium]
MPHDRVAGIVLAAGESIRMREPKALLRAGGDTFLERTIAALKGGGCAPVVAVVRPDMEAAREAAERAGARPVVNAGPGSEQVDSLRLALASLSADVAAAVVLPVDHPLVRGETVAALIAAWRGSPDRIARPVHEGRPGHPTLFPRTVWPAFTAELPRGARSVVEDEAQPRLDVPVGDPGVLADVDTPAAFARWVKGR